MVADKEAHTVHAFHIISHGQYFVAVSVPMSVMYLVYRVYTFVFLLSTS
jgi:hypothetical protein